MKIKDVVLIQFENGSYIKDPSFVDYHDGEGIQIDGGLCYDKDGNLVGHADPPGPRGSEGKPGNNYQVGKKITRKQTLKISNQILKKAERERKEK